MVLPLVPIKFSPQKSPLVPRIVGKSIKIDSVVCLGITLHHILVKFSHLKQNSREELWGLLGTNGELRQQFYPERP